MWRHLLELLMFLKLRELSSYDYILLQSFDFRATPRGRRHSTYKILLTLDLGQTFRDIPLVLISAYNLHNVYSIIHYLTIPYALCSRDFPEIITLQWLATWSGNSRKLFFYCTTSAFLEQTFL